MTAAHVSRIRARVVLGPSGHVADVGSGQLLEFVVEGKRKVGQRMLFVCIVGQIKFLLAFGARSFAQRGTSRFAATWLVQSSLCLIFKRMDCLISRSFGQLTDWIGRVWNLRQRQRHRLNLLLVILLDQV